MRFIRGSEKGSTAGLVITILVLLLAGVLAGWLVWRYLGGPSNPARPARATPSVPGPRKVDPSVAAENLLKALNDKLDQLNLLKLLTREVSSRPATVQGKFVSTFQENFRLPLRYNLGQIGQKLQETADRMGARITIENNSMFFRFADDWTPVEMIFERSAGPRVCLIIDDGGYQGGEALSHLYALKIPVTVAIIPDVEFSKTLAEEFPSHGVEVMCHMPMEGHEKGAVGGDYDKLLKKGMKSLLTREKVGRAVDSLPNCRGLNNHMGSVATTDPELMWDVCQVLKDKNLFIIDSRTTAESVVEPVAKRAGLAVTHRDVFLDNVETPAAILKQLDQLVRRAKKHGVAVGIGHFKTTTLKTLEGAVPRLRAQGIEFVYASEVVKE